MVKGGKLGKLIRAVSKLGRTNSGSIAASPCDDSSWNDSSIATEENKSGFQAVYVGKSRRRYLISSHLVDHPLFRNLIEKSSGESNQPTVGCEVVLFDHLLWMLENADPQQESLDELVEFYAC